MRIGIVGSVLVVLGAGAAAGALVMRDQAALEQAISARDAALAQLQQGELPAALAAFDRAALAASQVGPLTGKRSDALAIADEARNASLALTALEHAEQDPRRALSFLDPDGESLRGLALSGELLARVGRLRADRLLEAALSLEAKEDVARAPKLFQAAIEAGQAAGSTRLDEAQRGLDRAEVRRALAEAEAAVAAERDDEALERVKQAQQGAAAQAEAFPEAERSGLERRLTAVQAEVADRRAIGGFADSVSALAQRVSSSALGELLPEAERLSPPSLKGGHPRAESLQAKLAAAEAILGKVRDAARDFAGMVLARRRGMTLVFVDRLEVTNAEYAAFLGAHDDRKAPKTWRRDTVPDGQERHPVTAVSPEDAEAYATWKGKRLPALDEWREATVNAKDDFPWGAGWKPNAANLKEAAVGATREVGSYPAGKGPSGALDLIGNVREIVTGAGGFRAVGGSYRTDAPRSSAQTDGVELTPRTRFSDVGFRCAKELQWDG